MPVVFREDGLRYFFYSNEGMPREPRHVHVRVADATPKSGWSRKLRSRTATASIPRELSRILRVVTERRELVAEGLE